MVNLLSMEHSLDQGQPNQVNELIKEEVQLALAFAEITEESYNQEESEIDLTPNKIQLDGGKTPSRNHKPALLVEFVTQKEKTKLALQNEVTLINLLDE